MADLVEEKFIEYSIKKNRTDIRPVRITGSKISEKIIREFYNEDIGIYESFFVLFLARDNRTVGFVKISQGGLNGTVIDARLIAFHAINSLCSSVILAHNHPSGNVKPSRPDKDMTEKIKDGLDMFDIKVLDHIILTEDTYFSFADECEL